MLVNKTGNLKENVAVFGPKESYIRKVKNQPLMASLTVKTHFPNMSWGENIQGTNILGSANVQSM